MSNKEIKSDKKVSFKKEAMRQIKEALRDLTLYSF
jgi:hypothetical protein